MEEKAKDFILTLLANAPGRCMPISRVYGCYAKARHLRWGIVIGQLVESGEVEIAGEHFRLTR